MGTRAGLFNAGIEMEDVALPSLPMANAGRILKSIVGSDLKEGDAITVRLGSASPDS